MYNYGKQLIERTEYNLEQFKNKKEYLQFRKIWTMEYMVLSAKIRKYKSQRKEYLWSYREKINNIQKKKSKIADNPHYDYLAASNARILRLFAKRMLDILEKAKAKSWENKQKEKQLVN